MIIKNIIFIVPLFLIFLSSCTTVTPKSDKSTGLYWVANASQVDFDDLYELHEEISSPVDKKVARYEGFFDQYNEGEYTIPTNQQHGMCLSPEAEWMIYFPPKTQDEIKKLMGDITDWNDPITNDTLRALNIELRGMIEGKWLDVLRDESRKPKWIIASGGNNVVSNSINASQLKFTIKGLDERLKNGSSCLSPKIEIYKVQGNQKPDVQKPIYHSSFDDLANSALIKAIIEGNREPVLAIMKAVLKKFNAIHGDYSEEVIKGINFSAKGANAALVNSKNRIEKAKDSPFYTKAWYVLRYFTTDQPRIGMRLITERAVDEKFNCLSEGEKYILYLYGNTNEEIGVATLSLQNK